MRYQVNLKYQYRLAEYLTLTSFVWFLYLIWLVPFMLYWVGLEDDMDRFMNWLITGTIFNMILTYPIVKASIKYGPKITLYWDKLSKKHDKKKRGNISNKTSGRSSLPKGLKSIRARNNTNKSI